MIQGGQVNEIHNFQSNVSVILLLLQEFGEVETARVLKDASGVSKGIGFVQFANSEDAEAAITGMNGKRVRIAPVCEN